MATVLCVGIAVQDFVFSVERLPEGPFKHRATGFRAVGGGSAATAAAAVAKLGGRALLATRLGDDQVADLIMRELEDYGVDMRFARRHAGRRSSVSAVMVDAEGERMVINDIDLPPDAEGLPDLSAEGVQAVLADLRWPEAASVLLSQAKDAGLLAIVDADRPNVAEAELFKSATHVAFSAPGLRGLTGLEAVEDGLRAARDMTGAWLAATGGPKGVFILEGKDVTCISAFPIRAVDTLGAGDVWHGAFALRLAEGADERAAVLFANAAAALKCLRPGGRAGTPTRDEVEKLLKDAS